MTTTYTKREGDGLPVQPRRPAMARTRQVMELIKSMRSTDGYRVDYDKDAGTVTATFDGLIVYWAMRKGGHDQPWIVSYSAEYFGGIG